jgi:hypothetical protein
MREATRYTLPLCPPLHDSRGARASNALARMPGLRCRGRSYPRQLTRRPTPLLALAILGSIVG